MGEGSAKSLSGHKSKITAMGFSDNGLMLFTCSADHTVKVCVFVCVCVCVCVRESHLVLCMHVCVCMCCVCARESLSAVYVCMYVWRVGISTLCRAL